MSSEKNKGLSRRAVVKVQEELLAKSINDLNDALHLLKQLLDIRQKRIKADYQIAHQKALKEFSKQSHTVTENHNKVIH